MRKFTGFDFMKDSVPDKTTPCNIRHLLKRCGLNKYWLPHQFHPGKSPEASNNAIDWVCWIEKCKSSIHCKVKYIFRVIECQFGYQKIRCPGLRIMRVDCTPCLPVRTLSSDHAWVKTTRSMTEAFVSFLEIDATARELAAFRSVFSIFDPGQVEMSRFSKVPNNYITIDTLLQ